MTHAELKKEAIRASKVFGGWVSNEMKYIVDELVSEGIAEFSCRDSEGYGYNLTSKGKALC